jgi:hypothetical protein
VYARVKGFEFLGLRVLGFQGFEPETLKLEP